ncbi:MAG: Bacillopeptidase [Gammaproteobacteria bacterium]|nr:Bacillopeptidase [Gammaproteobacteria bacterium]
MRYLCLAAAVSAAATLLLCKTAAAALSPALLQLAQGEQADVIVIMRDQIDSTPATRSWRAARTSAVDAAQGGVVARLREMRAQKIGKFRLINALSAKVSREQAVELAANPLVQAVVPDAVMRAPRHTPMRRASLPLAIGSASNLCGTLEPEALQLTNTAFLDSQASQAQSVIDGNGKTVTGRGVKVAFLADGIDPNNQGFIRADGSKVFVDYKDFSGDPAGTPTGGAEAFGDASSIAAQDMPNGKPLIFDISAQSIPGRLPSPCRIRIRGVAPGASLVGLKIYSSLGYTNESSFIRGIEYAVLDADVDVINESFAGNFYPDRQDDPVTLASAWAVRAGVTVVTSTGDAGTAGTLGDPSTSPAVIAVGASTSFRAYAQLGGLGIEPLESLGYLSNNISSLSSGGFAQLSARTVDIVAPGDVGWALCSTNVKLYQACGDFNGNPSAFQLFGGTSQSTPFTSGAAALVIQAYRSTHHGADPSPALVKRILMSTATDLRAPASEQGAGLINTLAAVKAALAIADEQGVPARRGDSVIMQPTSVTVVDDPGSSQVAEIALTNTGTSMKHVVPHLLTLNKPLAGNTLSLSLKPGATAATVRRTFIVPAGAEHLDAAIAYQNDIASIALVDLQLIDPQGRIAAYSLPQGVGNGYGHVDVVSPTPGQWTAIVSTPPAVSPVSYTGPVKFSWSVQRWISFGAVSPATLDLPPGVSKSFNVRFRMPANAGDRAAAIRFEGTDGNGLRASVPISVRSLIAVDAGGGTFVGELTGGNGRSFAGPTQNFEFDVPRGARNLDLTVDIADNGYALQGFLIDPHGLPLSVQPNLDPTGSAAEYGLRLLRREPEPGRWRFTLLQNYNSSGERTSLPFQGRLSFKESGVTASGLPDRANIKLAAGRPVDASVRVTNSGPTTLAYFVDARRDAVVTASLAPKPQCAVAPSCAQYYIPPATGGVVFVAHSDRPIDMDALPESGFFLGITNSPDLLGHEVAPGTLVASLFAPEIPYGPWGQYPAFVGPFGREGAPVEPIDTAAFIVYQPFDPAVTSDRGNKWLDLMTGTNTYAPLVLAPGQTGTIRVRITPDGSQAGKRVSGNLYVETYNDAVLTGDEVARIPYTYTVTP